MVTGRCAHPWLSRIETWRVSRLPHPSELESQGYLADALGVPRSAIVEEGWPGWLRHAIGSMASVLEPPWSLVSTMQVLQEMAGGPMDPSTGPVHVHAGQQIGEQAGWFEARPSHARQQSRRRSSPGIEHEFYRSSHRVRQEPDIVARAEVTR
jgi:hypothetical protein